VKLTCDLCGDLSDNVRSGLACYADDGRFERIDRCTDHQSCRERLFLEGEDWPLVDVTDPPRAVVVP
jgi:hypothetical protein